jgi:hypothetical protein
MFAIYSGLFYSILGWLDVREARFKRGVILAGLLTFSEILSGIIASFFPVPYLGFVLGTVLIVVIFYFFVKNLLVLKTWQAIAIPIGVNLVGGIILGVLTMLVFMSMPKFSP